MNDLVSFVLISALIIVTAGYLGIYFVKKSFNVSQSDIQMVMLTIMVIINIANYFSIVITKDDNNKLTYLLYGFMILILYIFLAATNIDSGVILFLKMFYEIEYIRPELWITIMTVSLIGSFVLFAAQKLREKIINKN